MSKEEPTLEEAFSFFFAQNPVGGMGPYVEDSPIREEQRRREQRRVSDEPQTFGGNIGLHLVLPAGIMGPWLQKLMQRNSTPEEFIRLAIRQFMNSAKVYKLHDTLCFGKYYGESLESVIKIDPSYIQWCCDSMSKFGMSQEAHDLLQQVLEGIATNRQSRNRARNLYDIDVAAADYFGRQ